MDEEKQNQSFLNETGSKLREADKERAKKAKTRKKIKKIIKYVPILLWAIVIIIVGLFVVSVILDFLDRDRATTSRQAYTNALAYSTDVTGENSLNRIIVDANSVTEDGAYKLTYEFKDEDGNVLTEEEALENIKNDLTGENAELDLSSFSDQELKIIGALMYNGLKVNQYNEEELKALILFLKVDIANQNFDLRNKEEIGQEVSLGSIEGNDEVYGTLQVVRTNIVSSDSGIEYNPQNLEYMKYDEFTSMVEAKNLDVIKYFSVDEEGKLLVAKWSTYSNEYTYQNTDESELTEEQMAMIPEELRQENDGGTNITVSKIEYKTYIKKYVANYALLSNLLVVTKNVDFCKELAELSLNSKIVINVKEERTVTDTTVVSDYTQTTLLYDYVKYNIYGQRARYTGGVWEYLITDQPGSPSAYNGNLYGWNTNTSRSRSINGGALQDTYTWRVEETNAIKNYELIHNITNNSFSLKRKVNNITYDNLEEEIQAPYSGELIEGEGKHVTEVYEEYTIDEVYTDDEVFSYKITTKSYSEGNRCTFEISEVDSWYIKYKKEYNPPEDPTTSRHEEPKDEGQYPQEATLVLSTTAQGQIQSDEHVINFIEKRKEAYINKYAEQGITAVNVECNVSELRVFQKSKTAVSEVYDSTSTTYKFGEEIADTTEVSLKNVEYVNDEPSFTNITIDEDGNEKIEEGFLYIYDKYIKLGIDLYLQNDSEEKLFKLLEEDPTTTNASNIIKYLLYVYDGIDRGVTEFDLSIFDTTEFKSGAYASGDIPLYTPILTRDEFIAAMSEFSASGASGLKTNFDRYFLSRVDEIYDLGEKYGINPELIVVFAWKEQGFGDPVGNESNFWGLAVPNGQTWAPNYGSFEGGVEALATVFQNYNAGSGGWQEELIMQRYEERREYNLNGCGLPGTLRGLMSIYTCWLSESRNYHEEGNWGTGGRCYLKITYGDEYEAKCGSVHRDGEPYTMQEFADTAACAYEQVIDKWNAIYGNYGTISAGMGGITTQEEADALTEYYNEMLNTVVHSGNYQMQNGPFPNCWYNGLSPFQCTWWANGRASMYLEEYGTKYTKYPTQMGHGGAYYRINVENGWFNYGDTPRPNSIVCWGAGIDNSYGHVAYVEGVTEDGIWISHAGSGKSWYGVTFVPNGDYLSSANGYIYLDEPL